MCGIAGILGDVSEKEHARVVRMNEAQRHRGPDADVVKIYPGAVLGHRRLSIIDLSDMASQPMETPNGRYTIVFNGEIYNYKELRNTLRSYPYRTNSDTEVLLAAWEQWGEDCLARLRGMFAFCIWDTREQRAFFARDRFGQKPLFFAQMGTHFLFASEVKALLAVGLEAKPDRRVWARYLAHASYDDDAATFFEGVEQLCPGECAAWSLESGLHRRMYYDVREHIPERPLEVSADEAAQHIRDLLIETTQIHMRADVPVGVSLSGGLDSSALLACIDEGGNMNELVHCFSCDYGADFSERPWIEAAAHHHGLQSDIRSFTPEAFRESIRPLMWSLEGPIGGLANCGSSLVLQAAHEQGVVVIQDGTGLDEAFAGYRNHHNLFVGLMLAEGGARGEEAAEQYARMWEVNLKDARRAGTAELKRTRDAIGTTIDGTLPTRVDLLDAGFAAEHVRPMLPIASKPDLLRSALAEYLQTSKVPRNTRMKDRLSMAYSLELRLPFLDHKLVEYALSIPPHLYFLYGRTKSIVREALRGVMDDSVRLAQKRSIQAPQGQWLRKEPMRSYIGDLITSQSFRSRGIFHVERVQKAFDDFCRDGAPNSFFVWQWMNLEEWYRTFVDAPLVFSHVPLNRKMPLSTL